MTVLCALQFLPSVADDTLAPAALEPPEDPAA